MPVRPSADFELPCAQVKEKAVAALNGDAQEAVNLAAFYGEVGDDEQILYWYQVAMENGSEAGLLSYASALIARGDEYSVIRAKHLLKGVNVRDVARASVLRKEAEKRSVDMTLVMAGEGPKHCNYFGSSR
jgi:TPR repeat protein